MQNDQQFGAIGGRAWLGSMLVSVCALHAAAVHAQTSQDKHHLYVQAGNQFHSDNEVDRFDGLAEFLWQDGVPGVNQDYFRYEALADGDSGVLAISAVFSAVGGLSVARFEETINPGATTSDTVTVTAQLDWSGSGQVAGGNGRVAAGLRMGNCIVYFQKSLSLGTGQGTDCTNSETNFGTSSAGLLTVTQILGTPIGGSTRVFMEAQLEGEGGITGEYEASGVLSIEVFGADYTFSSPTFLTVPEPGDAALVAAALGALAAIARRRRSVLA